MSDIKKEYIKGYAIKNVSEKYEFKKAELTEGISFVLDCSFYKTKHEEIYITDYRDEEDLEKRSTSMFIYNKLAL